MLRRLQTVLAAVLVAVVVSAGGVPPAAGGAATQETRRGADAARTTTVVAQPAAREERSAPITVLLVGLGAAVGVVVGGLPALVAALALGYLPPPRRRQRQRPASRVLAEPPPFELAPAPAAARAPEPAPVALAAAEPGDPSPDAPRQGQLAILAHARHQDVYDTAYAQQLERVGALRSAIGDRRRTAPEPHKDPGPAPPAKGTS
jgi:hypothetical protein